MSTRVVVTTALAVLVAASAFRARADNIHSQNSKANSLYKKGEYEKALELYDKAALEAPAEKRLQANRGNALQRMGKLDEAEEAYQRSLELPDPASKAAVHYNRGNNLYRQGEKALAAGGQGALEKFQEAVGEYGRALDISPKDRDAKWNLQLAWHMAEQVKKMQQNQDQDKQDKNKDQDEKQKQNQDKQDKQDNQDKEQNQDKQDKDQKQDQDKQDKDQEQQQDQQKDRKQQPQPQDAQEEMKKEEAARLIRQFADDDKNLNKPQKKVPAGAIQPEKDW